MVPHRITWKMELPSLKQHIVKAVLSIASANRPASNDEESATHLIGKALCVVVPWGLYHV